MDLFNGKKLLSKRGTTISFNSRFETSAKDNSNIEEATRCLVSAIVKLEEENVNNTVSDEVSVKLGQQQRQQNNGCC